MLRTTLIVFGLFLLVSSAQAKYSGGSGTAEDPYQISTAADMNDIDNNPNDLDKYFLLTNDIDLSAYTGEQFNIIGPFTGVFDGNDHTISNFTYTDLTTGNVAIFSYIDGSSAQIRNLGVIDPNVVAGGGGYGYVASLVGVLANGSISNCYMENGNISIGHRTGGLIGGMINGTVLDCYVRGASIYGDRFLIGGLVGAVEAGTISGCYTTSCSVSGYHGAGGLAGDVDPCATVTNCHSDSSVSGAYGYGSLDDCSGLGGLIGYNSGTVSNCHATGAVSGIVGAGAGGYFGGLIGDNGGTVSACYATGNISEGWYVMGGLVGGNGGDGTISDCYATGNVTGIEWLGGLAGGNSGTITNSYSTGSVSGTSSVGGLLGTNTGTVTTSFWDKQTSGQTTSAGGTGKTTAEMQDPLTFFDAGWDFTDENANGTEDIWRLCVDLTDYPRFVWEKRLLGDFLCPDGSDFKDYAVLRALGRHRTVRR
jgi:hypothetical protein